MLHPPVMPRTQQPSIAPKQRRADRNPTLRQTQTRFVKSHGQHLTVGQMQF